MALEQKDIDRAHMILVRARSMEAVSKTPRKGTARSRQSYMERRFNRQHADANAIAIEARQLAQALVEAGIIPALPKCGHGRIAHCSVSNARYCMDCGAPPLTKGTQDD